MVRMLHPQTLLCAFGMAKMQEENIAALRRVARFGPNPSKRSLALPAAEPKVIVQVQKLSPTQMKERSDKGMNYNCNDKWAREHKCRAAKLFIMECEDLGNEEDIQSTP